MAITINGFTPFTYGATDLSPTPIVEPLVAVQEDVTKDFIVQVPSGTVLATGNTIACVLIPKGAIVFDYLVNATANLGASTVYDIGDTETDNFYFDSANDSAIAFPQQGQLGAVPNTYANDDVFVLTIDTGDTVGGEGAAVTIFSGWLRYNMRGNVF